MPTSEMTAALEAAADCLLILANGTAEITEEAEVRRNAAHNLRALADMLTPTSAGGVALSRVIPKDFPRIHLV